MRQPGQGRGYGVTITDISRVKRYVIVVVIVVIVIELVIVVIVVEVIVVKVVVVVVVVEVVVVVVVVVALVVVACYDPTNYIMYRLHPHLTNYDDII